MKFLFYFLFMLGITFFVLGIHFDHWTSSLGIILLGIWTILLIEQLYDTHS